MCQVDFIHYNKTPSFRDVFLVFGLACRDAGECVASFDHQVAKPELIIYADIHDKSAVRIAAGARHESQESRAGIMQPNLHTDVRSVAHCLPCEATAPTIVSVKARLQSSRTGDGPVSQTSV